MKPSVGRIVHYVQYDGNRCRAAIVTDVTTDSVVNLYVFSADQFGHGQSECSQDEESKAHGTWHWPERVE